MFLEDFVELLLLSAQVSEVADELVPLSGNILSKQLFPERKATEY